MEFTKLDKDLLYQKLFASLKRSSIDIHSLQAIQKKTIQLWNECKRETNSDKELEKLVLKIISDESQNARTRKLESMQNFFKNVSTYNIKIN